MGDMKWHMLDTDSVFRQLATRREGLTTAEFDERLKTYGQNEIKEGKKTTALELFVGQFKNLLVGVLIFAAVASFALGELFDGAVIAVIIIVNGILGFYQERKAEHALAALKKLTVSKTTVIRNGQRQVIDSHHLVPGDIIYLEAGDRVPADARIIEQSSVKIDESILTGESIPVSKNQQPLGDVAMPDRVNIAFSGTNVVYGDCLAVVYATAMSTEFGKIAEKLQGAEEDTPLQKRLETLGRQLSFIIMGVAVVVFIAGFFHGIGLFEMFLVAVSLAVAAIPEGLPAIVTITLAIGLVRMSRRNAIVRRLPATESLGSVTVICSDKTGTLTKNQMTVRKLWVPDQVIDFDTYSGHLDSLDLMFTVGMLCNNASDTTGDPTEIALLKSAKKYGIVDPRGSIPRLHETPFDSERKMMSAVYNQNGQKMFTKGAVEEILAHCTKIYRNGAPALLTTTDRQAILAVNQQLTRDALRVLAFAYKPVSEVDAPENELIFVGLQGMIDPPRAEVKDSIAKCYSAGIKVVMITGDHQNTAEAIARELGIQGKSITGMEMEAMNDLAFEQVIDDIAIYARTSPEHKVRITEMLRRKGHIVAMSGDGVNDAPALKKADIGIAVGSGTDVTKEAADIVLTDDNFSTIVTAVEEGRGIYDNIKKFVNYLLSANFAEVIIIFSAIMMNLPLPLLPLQLLWINITTDGLPALALGVEAPDKDIMTRRPRNPKEKILNRATLTLILSIGLLLAIGVLGLFMWYLPDVARARTVAFCTITIAELFLAMNFRSRLPLYKIGFFTNKKLMLAILSSVVLQVAVIYLPILNTVFDTIPLAVIDWARVLGFCLLLFVIVEVLKGRVGK